MLEGAGVRAASPGKVFGAFAAALVARDPAAAAAALGECFEVDPPRARPARRVDAPARDQLEAPVEVVDAEIVDD